MVYDAFVSYSHAREAALARAIQSALHRFARPWYRMRALRVFRDVTNLSANPGLWSAIEQALSEARYFLLLASPQSAASPWVQREVEWWLGHRQADHLLLVLVDGGIQWDDTARDFNWTVTTVLPRGLAGAFREEPLYVDFRGFRSTDELSLTNSGFSDRIASLAAALHGRPKDEMIGEDVRQHRRTMRVAWSAVAALALLAGTAATAAFVAVQQRNIAIEQRRIAVERQKLAEAREIVARAELLRSGRPELHAAGLLLAAEGLRRLEAVGAPTWEADQALRRSLALTPEPVAVFMVGEPVTAFGVSREGPRVAAGTRRGLVRVWAAGSDRPAVEYAHGDRVSDVAFSPDGTLIASASWDATVGIADVASGSLIGTFQHPAPVWAVAFSPDGKLLVSGSRDGLACVWDLRSRRVTASVKHDSLIMRVRFSANGRTMVLQGADGVALLVDVAAMKSLGPVSHPIKQLDSTALSPDGKRLATRSMDHTYLIDIPGDRQLARVSEPSIGPSTIVEGVSWTDDAIAFSADGGWLYLANRDRSARVVDGLTGAVVRTIPHDQPVRGVAASADGKRFATRAGSVVRLWDSASGAETGRLNHEGVVTHMGFLPQGGYVATVASSQIRLWRERTGNPVLSVPHGGGTWHRLFSRDGRWLVSQDPHQVVSIWEAASGARVAQFRHPDLIRHTRFSDDGSHVATACNDRKVRVWELPSGRSVAEFDAAGLSSSLAFSPDGTQLATAVGGGRPEEGGRVHVWDWRSGRRILHHETRKGSGIVAFSPDGGRLAFSDTVPSLHVVSLAGPSRVHVLDGHVTGSEPFSAEGRTLLAWKDRTVAMIDLETAKPVQTLELAAKVRWAELAPKSGMVAIDTRDKVVHLWNGRTRGSVIALTHELEVNSVRFSRDEQQLATGSGHPITGRGETRAWAVRDGSLVMLQPDDRGAWTVDFSADGSRIATQARELPTRVWIASRAGLLAEVNARATRNLTHAEWRQFLPAEPYPLLCDSQPVHPSVEEAAGDYLLDGDEAAGLRLCERIVELSARNQAKRDVREEAARLLVARSVALAQAGSVTRALRGMERVRELNPKAVISPGDWNLIAWAGATRGHAGEMLFAVERAIKSEPGNINYLDTRGLIRALTGDVPGAIDDFKVFVAGARDYPARMVEQRHLWLAALALGKNPFTEDVLNALRDE